MKQLKEESLTAEALKQIGDLRIGDSVDIPEVGRITCQRGDPYGCGECLKCCIPHLSKPCLKLPCARSLHNGDGCYYTWKPEFVKPFQEVLDDLISAVHKEAEVRKEIEHDQEKGLCPFGLIGMQVELLEKIRELRDVLLRRHEEKRG